VAEKSKWDVYAFESSATFNSNLIRAKITIGKRFSDYHRIRLFRETAAWIYDGTLGFYLKTVNKKSFWRPILSNDDDLAATNVGGITKMFVRCAEIARIVKLYGENDFLVLKMDVDGAEYKLLADFLDKDVLKLIDVMIITFHSDDSFNRGNSSQNIRSQLLNFFVIQNL
jgi:FkbM family methyltransferase